MWNDNDDKHVERARRDAARTVVVNAQGKRATSARALLSDVEPALASLCRELRPVLPAIMERELSIEAALLAQEGWEILGALWCLDVHGTASVGQLLARHRVPILASLAVRSRRPELHRCELALAGDDLYVTAVKRWEGGLPVRRLAWPRELDESDGPEPEAAGGTTPSKWLADHLDGRVPLEELPARFPLAALLATRLTDAEVVELLATRGEPRAVDSNVSPRLRHEHRVGMVVLPLASPRLVGADLWLPLAAAPGAALLIPNRRRRHPRVVVPSRAPQQIERRPREEGDNQ